MATKKSPARFIDTIMNCHPVSRIPEGPNWTYEIKLYRLATGVWTWNFCWGKHAMISVPRMSMDTVL
jgi:hypothetical protein